MDPNGIMQLIILVILILLSAFFSSAETALTTVNKYALRSMADSGNKRAARVLKVTENSAKLISTILIGNNIVNISASSLATTLTTRVFGSAAVGISTGILTLLILIFGEITPKTVAQLYSVKISLLYVDIIKFLMFVLTPVIWIVNKLADAIFFILRIDKNNTGAKITEDELRTVVNVSEEEGVIEDEEKEMITNVVDFGDSRVRDVMIPRVDMTVVDVDADYDTVLNIYMKVPYTRIPVYEGSKDHIIGLLHIKDLFFYRATHKDEDFKIRSIMREPLYVFEFQKTNDLLSTMKSTSNSAAIALNEYGLCAGLVTTEDLVEEIIGDIKDEYDSAEHNNIVKLDDTHYSVNGSINLDDLNDALGLDIRSEDYDSLGGYIIELLDHLPKQGDTVTDGVIFCKVTQMVKNRVLRVLVEILPKAEKNEETK